MFKIDLKKLSINNTRINKKKSLIINITGDWTPLSEKVSNIMIKKKKIFYGNLLSYFEKGDLNITNMESVIDDKSRQFNKNALKFINKPQVLNSLKHINTNLVCLANNHIMDNGVKGLKSTIKYLRKYKIGHVGAEFSISQIYKPFLFKKNRQKIAVINTSEGEEANERYNNHIGSSDIESYRIIDQIRNYKNKGFLTILIAHAGIEYLPSPAPYIKEIYQNFVDEGADLVVGHHPHVPQGFEIYKNVPIFYSLGNFTMWKKKLRKQCYQSFFLNIEINENKFSRINLIPFRINKNGLELISEHEYSKKILELNNFLTFNDKIWQAYLNRKNSKGGLFLEQLSFFYNFDEYKNNILNLFTNISKKYSELDYLKYENKKNLIYENILDRWQINKNRNFFSLFKNIFKPLYLFFKVIKKILKNLITKLFE